MLSLMLWLQVSSLILRIVERAVGVDGIATLGSSETVGDDGIDTLEPSETGRDIRVGSIGGSDAPIDLGNPAMWVANSSHAFTNGNNGLLVRSRVA